jgi:hypothetical protein
MSVEGSTVDVTAFEADMREIWRARRPGLSDVTRRSDNDYSGMVSGISVKSVQEIDNLIAGLQALRQKLRSDGDRLNETIAQHAALSQSVIELTKIVSDGMKSVNKSGDV